MKLLLNILILLSSLGINQGQQGPQIGPTSANKNDQFERTKKIGKEAIEEARQRVAANPDSAEAHFNLAEMLTYGPIAADENDQIREEYLKAIELKPDYAEACLKLGTYYANHDKYEKGYEAIKKAISLKLDYAEAYVALGFAYVQKKFADGHGLPHTEEESTNAVKAFNKALQIEPELVRAYVGLGIAKNYLGQSNEALQAFKQAVSLNPNDVISHLCMGDYYIQLGDRNDAIKEYEVLKRIASDEQADIKATTKLAEAYSVILLKQIQERFGK